MIDYRIFENSYLVAIIAFFALCVLFYIFGLGFQESIVNGQKVKTFTYRYQIVLALLVWLLWKFLLYPASEEPPSQFIETPMSGGGIGDLKMNLKNYR